MSRLILMLIATLILQPCVAQKTPIEVLKTTESIVFDGKIDEEVWEKAKPFPMTRQSPDYGSEPSEKTDVRIVYDNDFLYMGSKLFHKDVSKIQDYSKKRDGGGPMDYMTIVLDGYNDQTNGLVFATTPAGLRWDGSVTFDSKGLSLTSDWNTYWEVKTSRDDKGWYAEFKIPLSSLRFNSNSEEVIMNLVLYRKIASKNEFSVFPNIPPNWGLLSFANIAEGYPILFRDIKNNNPIYVTPFILGGLGGNNQLNETGTTYKNSSISEVEAGLDVKYSLSSKLTLDATVNTDFAQVEADNFQVNLTRSSLFFPEKREFFLERTTNFSFGFDLNNDVFYSRRIGLENGQVSRIYGGARVVGRIQKWDIGFLDMQTEDIANNNTKNVGLLRIKKQIRGGNSYLGGIFTSSLGKNGTDFFTYGLDGQLVLPLKSFFKIAMAKSVESSVSNSLTLTDNLRVNAKLEKPSQVGAYYLLGYSLVGKDYNPVLGFEERENIKRYDFKVGYALFSEKAETIFKQIAQLSSYKIDSYENNNKESFGVDFQYNLEMKSGATLNLKPYYREEALFAPLLLSEDVAIPIGGYHFKGLNTALNTATGKSLSANAFLEVGSFYNGKKTSSGILGRFDGSKLIQFQLDYRYDRVNFGNDLPQFENHLVSLNSVLNFTTKLSISGLAQYNDLDAKIGANIRLRYNAREGNDLFISVTNINNTYRDREIPTLPSLQSWLAVIKYKHTFTF